MNRTTKAVVVGIVACLLAGCASNSRTRFALVDLDLRTPEQIKASREAVGNTPQVTAKAEGATPWYSFLPAIVEVFKGRLRLVSFESDSGYGYTPDKTSTGTDPVEGVSAGVPYVLPPYQPAAPTGGVNRIVIKPASVSSNAPAARTNAPAASTNAPPKVR